MSLEVVFEDDCIILMLAVVTMFNYLNETTGLSHLELQCLQKQNCICLSFRDALKSFDHV